MVDLSCDYLGLKLANPLVPSASPLTRDISTAKQLEDAGAPAIVMHSLFEEETRNDELHFSRFLLEQGIGHAEADTFLPEPVDFTSELQTYLEQLRQLKESLDIPVIASLNGISLDGWIDHGKELQEAGADALELNVYYIPTRNDETSQDVEQRYIELLTELGQHVTVPVTMKLSSQFSSLVHFVKQLERAGAAGVALFNRFYQPDIDIETLQVVPKIKYSSASEALTRIRWTAILYEQVNLSLAVTGGIHSHKEALKALLAGANITHMCSELLTKGPHRITEILSDMSQWMEEHEYESLQQLRGSVSLNKAIDGSAYERANYLSVLDSYRSAPGVWR